MATQPLKVFLAGRVAVESDGVVIDDARFPGRQGRLLFAYLAAEQGRPVPKDELAEAIWGEAPPPSWDKALTGVVSKVRALLSETASTVRTLSRARSAATGSTCRREHGSTSSPPPTRRWRRRPHSPPATRTRPGPRQGRPHPSHARPSCQARMGHGWKRSAASSPRSVSVR